MIDVSELMNDADFATFYKVIRSKGKFTAGRFQITEKQILSFYGCVQSASTKDLEQIPEGDRQKSIMKFFCAPPEELYITHADDEEYAGLSDIVEYRGDRYKIIQVAQWAQNGYCRAFGVKIG